MTHVAIVVMGRDGRVVKGIGYVTGGLQIQRPSAAKVFTLQYWAKLYAQTHTYANSAFYSPSGPVNEYRLQLGFKAGMVTSAGWQLTLCKPNSMWNSCVGDSWCWSL